jgi:hypothetical protein
MRKTQKGTPTLPNRDHLERAHFALQASVFLQELGASSSSSSPSSNHSPLVFLLYPLHSPPTTLGQHTPTKLAYTPVPPPVLIAPLGAAPKNSQLVV